MARGKLNTKRCKKGYRKTRKNRNCVKKSKSKSKAKAKRSTKSLKKSFLKGITTAESIPRKSVSEVITGVKDMENVGIKAIESLPQMSSKKSKSKSKSKTKGKKHKNPWIAHLSAYRRAHPGMKLGSAMKAATSSYKKVR